MSRLQTRSRRLALAGSAAVTALFAGQGAFASPAADAGSTPTVQEVVVTAEKRSEALSRVAAPVTAITADTLARTEAVRLEDYAAAVPGLNMVSSQEGQTQIVLRGITTGAAENTTVATYVDDAPYGSSTIFAEGALLTPDLDPSDLQRLEVLRGPQGTLYGASSMGGLLKFVTTQPDLETFAARAEVDGSTVDGGGEGWGVRGMTNLPLIKDTLALRISAYDRQDPGFIDDPQLDRKNINDTFVDGGHASLLWKPTDRLNVRLSVLLQDLAGRGTSEEDVDGTTLKPLYGDLIQKRFVAEPTNNRYRLYSGVINYDFGWATLVSATSYSTLQSNVVQDFTSQYGALLTSVFGTPNVGAALATPTHEEKFTEEVRLASPSSDHLEWQGGFFFTHERSTHFEQLNTFDTVTNAPISFGAPLVVASLLSQYTEYAGFGDVTYHINSQFDVQAGLRVAGNDQHYSQPEAGILLGGTSFIKGTSSDDSTTFLVTPRFRFNEDQMVYVRIASGYRPGGPNAVTPVTTAAGVPATFQPDNLTNYELGYKGSFFDRRLSLDLSGFYIDWRNIQLVEVINGVGAEGNGGSARSDGVEAQASFRPLAGLSFSTNLAYTDAVLTQDAPGVNGHSGDRLPNVPKFSANLSGDYDFAIAPTFDGFAGFSFRYVGDRLTGFVAGSPATFARPTIPAYDTIDLRIGFKHNGWTVEGYIKNASDSRGITNLASLALSGIANPYAAGLIQPRTFGMSLSSSF
jgi:iron complex outermembrane recepter protein